jgi:hypothetical protein
MKDNTNITGQLMTRDMGKDEHSGKPNRRLVMIFGLLSLPENAIQSEHQYVTVGEVADNVIHLTMLKDYAKDQSKTTRGMTPSGILCQPIWQV